MTREENLYWIDQEIRTWENDCQSKHPIKEALYAARKAVEREPRKSHWIIDGHHRRCPECGEYFCINDAEGNEIPSSFCPNCGADMREGLE